ncbi:MAG: BrnT family toxin [Clostridia bacterium]|nr:BrnT family toxin [Clostridia bacterium]
MNGLSFEWDEKKNKINTEKHGISFEEAKTVFWDENALLEYDALHSKDEDRFRILGCSNKGNVLLVVHCVREENVIRIISSRKATAFERAGYERSMVQ